MTPYATLSYFAVLAAVVLPMVVGALLGRVWRGWVVVGTVVLILVQYIKPLQLAQGVAVPELVGLLAFAIYEWLLLRWALRRRRNKTQPPPNPWYFIPAALAPLAVAKYLPLALPDSAFGFAGISYVTFRVLDVLWMVTDGVLAELSVLDFFIYVFFFPTLSAGPIDRFRRFQKDWNKQRTPREFWQDLDAGVSLVFRGLLYKFIIALLIEDHMQHHEDHAHGVLGAIQYAYVYSAYLFFDFAGYSAFAVGVSRWFGIKSPENFAAPFAAQNIKDFWNRWHISLSFWFRDHVYTRFLLKAVKRKWFKKREVASSVAYFVSFGLMGVWHGAAWHYIIYGLYHAALLSGYDAFTRWKKRNPGKLTWVSHPIVATFITIQCVCFGLWIFSGHGIIPKEPTKDDAANAAQVAKP